jgi:hypothetical protein
MWTTTTILLNIKITLVLANRFCSKVILYEGPVDIYRAFFIPEMTPPPYHKLCLCGAAIGPLLLGFRPPCILSTIRKWPASNNLLLGVNQFLILFSDKGLCL